MMPNFVGLILIALANIVLGEYIGITLSVHPSIFFVSATPQWMDRY